MITKRNIADIVKSDLSGGDPSDDSKFHKAMIYKRTEMVLNTLMMQNFIEHRNENSYDIDGVFVVPFPDVTVQYDAKRDEKFSDLPGRVVSLPDGRGIRSVTLPQEKGTPFIAMANGQAEMMSLLEAGNLGGKRSYYIEQNRIYYKNVADSINEVFIRMVVSVENLRPDEAIPIPAAYEDKLVEMVKQRMMIKYQTPEDKYNDNNPNTPK